MRLLTWSRHLKKNGASALLPRLRLRPQAVVAEATTTGFDPGTSTDPGSVQ